MLPDIPGMTSAAEPIIPIRNRSAYPPKLSENRSTSLPMGIKERESANRRGIKHAIRFIALILPCSLSVTDGNPPIARPTNKHTVGNGNSERAHESGTISAYHTDKYGREG